MDENVTSNKEPGKTFSLWKIRLILIHHGLCFLPRDPSPPTRGFLLVCGSFHVFRAIPESEVRLIKQSRKDHMCEAG